MSAPDPFEQHDVAYVFGALPPAEVAQFEAHLATCAACTARVAQARDLTALLTDITEAEVVAAVPDTLLPGLLRRAAGSRRRQRRVTAGLAGVVAACLITIGVLAWPSSPTTPQGRSVTLSALVRSPVRATAVLIQTPSGTQIKLHCTYAGGAGGEPSAWYGLVVVDKQDHAHQLSNWTLGPGEDQVFPASTALKVNQISRIEVTYGSTPILQASV